MSDKRYYTFLAVLSVLICLSGAANVFVAGMTIDRLTAGIGFVLAIGAWVLLRYCAAKLKAGSDL